MSDNIEPVEYARILTNTLLKKLGFLEIHSVLHLENYEAGEMSVDIIKNDTQFPRANDADMYIILDKYKITGNVKNRPVFDIDTTIILLLETKEKIDDIFLTKFSKSTGKLIIYPYLRQTVQDLTSKMGLPALSLPLWQNPTTIKEEKKEAVPV